MRGSSIKIVRHIIKGELDVACVWGSRELISDAFFPSLSVCLEFGAAFSALQT